MKSLKFTAQEILDSLNRELNQDEINELYKGLIAYSVGVEEITPEVEIKLDKVIDFYFDNDDIGGMVNQEVIDTAIALLDL